MFERVTNTKSVQTTETRYKCPNCVDTFESEREAKAHYIKTHSKLIFKDTIFGDVVHAPNLTDLDTYLDTFDVNIRNTPEYAEFPGWFYIKFSNQPCPRSCCTDSVVSAVPVDELLDNQIRKIKECSETIRAIKNLSTEEIEK